MPKWQCTFFFCGVCVRATTNAKVNRACQRGTQTHTHKRACKQRSQCKWLGREWVSECVCKRETVRGGGWLLWCLHSLLPQQQAGWQAGSVGKCACSVKCFSKLLKIASKRNNNNVKVICDIVLCIVICPHTDTHTLTHTRRHTLTSVTLCQLLLLLFLLFLLSMVGCAQWVHRKK